MVDDPESRERGVLSPSDREYLRLGDRAYREQYSRQSAAKRDSAIPIRVRDAILDFRYLAEPDCFKDADLHRAVAATDDNGEPLTESIRGAGGSGDLNRVPVLDSEVEDGLAELIAFAFRAKPDQEYFERLVTNGVSRALGRLREEAVVGDVEVPIEDPETIADRVDKLLEEGHPLTNREIRVALEQEVRPPEDIARYVREHGHREEDPGRGARIMRGDFELPVEHGPGRFVATDTIGHDSGEDNDGAAENGE